MGQEMGSIGSQRWRAAGYGCRRADVGFRLRRSGGVQGFLLSAALRRPLYKRSCDLRVVWDAGQPAL